jgi:hypothetical protein
MDEISEELSHLSLDDMSLSLNTNTNNDNMSLSSNVPTDNDNNNNNNNNNNNHNNVNNAPMDEDEATIADANAENLDFDFDEVDFDSNLDEWILVNSISTTPVAAESDDAWLFVNPVTTSPVSINEFTSLSSLSATAQVLSSPANTINNQSQNTFWEPLMVSQLENPFSSQISEQDMVNIPTPDTLNYFSFNTTLDSTNTYEQIQVPHDLQEQLTSYDPANAIEYFKQSNNSGTFGVQDIGAQNLPTKNPDLQFLINFTPNLETRSVNTQEKKLKKQENLDKFSQQLNWDIIAQQNTNSGDKKRANSSKK